MRFNGTSPGLLDFVVLLFPVSGSTNILNEYLYWMSADRVANQSPRKTLSTVLVHTKRVYKGLVTHVH